MGSTKCSRRPHAAHVFETPGVQGVSQLLKQSDWAQIQDFK